MINFGNKLSSNDDRAYWITSDLHFYHNGILRFCKDTRHWGNLEEMHETRDKQERRLRDSLRLQ